MESSEALLALSSWSPASANLFEVSISDGDNGSILSGSYPRLHCTSFSFPEYGLSFTRDKGTKNLVVDKYSYPETVTIKWREDKNHSVRRFHQEWMNQFFDPETALWKSTNGSKDEGARRYKTFVIEIQDISVIPGGFNSTIPPEAQAYQTSIRSLSYKEFSSEYKTTHTLTLFGVLPPKMSPLDLDWTKTDGMEYSFSYPIADWNWESKL